MTRAGGRAVGGLGLAVCSLAAVGVAHAAPAAPLPATALAAPGGAPCATADGVTVIVDFHGEGGLSTLVGCAPGSPGSGIVALRDAGFTIEGIAGGAPFLCRIEQQPSADSGEDCVGTPPASAYWAYYTAVRGGAWTYADTGAGSRRPPPGSVEGWSFTRGGTASTRIQPRPAPPAALPATTTTTRPTTPTTKAPTTTVKPSTPAPTAPTPTTPTPTTPTGSGPAVTTPTQPGSSGPNPTTPSGGSSTATTRRTETGSPGTAAGAPSAGDDAPTSSTPVDAASGGSEGPNTTDPSGSNGDDTTAAASGSVELRDRSSRSGSPVAFALGGVGVAILAAAGILTARQRRLDADLPPDPGTG